MRTYNTMPRWLYILENIFWSMPAMIAYRWIYRGIDGFDKAQSAMIFCCIFALSVFGGIILTVDRRRNYGSIAVNVIVPLGIYTVVSYGRRILWGVVPVAVICLLLSAAMVYITVRPIPKRHPKYKIIRKMQIIHSFFRVRTVAALCVGVLLLPMTVNAILDEPFFSFTENVTPMEECTIDGNIETLSLLDEHRWKRLNLEEKLDVIGTVKDIERSYLGLPHDVSIVVGTTEKTVAAYYTDSNRTITIDRKVLEEKDGREILHIICHEMYHAYQYRLCDAYDSVGDDYKGLLAFCNVESYKQELGDYVSASDNFEIYNAQQLEQKADSYANDAEGDYFRRIEIYKNN